jgi:hypothetical protein
VAVQVPFTFNGTLSFPVDDGQPNSSVVVALSSLYQHQSSAKYELTGSGSKSVDFSTIATTGARCIVVEVLPDPSPAALPINVTFNAGTDTLQLSAGGFLVYANPNPAVGGVLSLTLAHTSAATVRVHVFG